jgi:serine/threonine protein kinase/TolB-like protein/Tfp pilus assembly protein PilF
MTPERWHQVSGVFHDALARDAEARGPFLDEVCAGDEELRAEVMALLEAHGNAGRFGERPLAFPQDLTNAGADPGIPDSNTVTGTALVGTMLGTYRIERLLGRGGMGVVYLAYDTTLRRRVALKVVASPAGDETAQARLLREARSAAALNHPSICTIHEVGDANGSAFIAMEYVDGRPLSDLLGDGALPVAEALRYAIHVADALAYAHDNGVVHRDFKAANVMITARRSLKIVDFGLARREDALVADATTIASLAPAGVAAGTPYAMAPEQVRGAGTDARTDIWALGVLLHQMVSGMKPFSASTSPELFSSILRDAPAPLPSGVPAVMRLVIERCLEKEPERRYEHAHELRAALEAIQAGTMPQWATWGARIRRHPWVAAAVAAFALITLLVSVNVGGVRERLLGSPPAAAEPIKLAVLPFENLTGDPEQEYFSDGLTQEMITQLGRLHPQRLSVIARTSSMRYKNRDVPLEEIGRELGVDYVLEGSARREGSRVRISATLIQVRDQTQRWADNFDRELAGILALQSDVARGVARSLALTLAPDARERLDTAQPVNPKAYEAYLRGLSHLEKLTRADLDPAMRNFEAALANDPTYALAYLRIHQVWAARQQFGAIAPSNAAPAMKAALTKALELKVLELDETRALAHYRLADQARTEFDWTTEEVNFRRAIDLDPNFAEARAFYSGALLRTRRTEEAIAQIQRAIELDPLNPSFQVLYCNRLVRVRRYDEAIVQCRNALTTAPDAGPALTSLGTALHFTGRYNEAVDHERMRATRRGDRQFNDALALGFAEGGYRSAMRRAGDLLAARARQTDGGRREDLIGGNELRVARFYLFAGENDQALDWLERGYEARDPNLPSISDSPEVDPLRNDPRFQALLRRLNLPK